MKSRPDQKKVNANARCLVSRHRWFRRFWRSVSQRRMPRETVKPSLTMIDGKPTGGTITRGKDQDGHGMMKSEIFFADLCGFRTLVVATTV